MVRVMMKTQGKIHNIKYVLNSIHWKAIFLFTLTFRSQYVDSRMEYFFSLVHSFELESCVRILFLHSANMLIS